MKVIGLTGGIASGKSTVSALLRERGAMIVDADQIAREIVQPGQDAWREIVDSFGTGILHPDKSLDRDKLRKIIFASEQARNELQSVMHPAIRALAQEPIPILAAAPGADSVIYGAPLLLEYGVHEWVRSVIVVPCHRETQRLRLATRDRLSAEESQRHLDAQMPLAEKIQLADYVIDNSGDLAELKKKVATLWDEIRSISPAPDSSRRKDPRGHDRQPE